ncbi:hypothetical protein PHMEG_0002897 [Phytophthora megakarya]|uniref:SAP domain-containing protein n=1 Tax=Phytophthora megakarya TaxID=4795 RepID=A0A225WZM4_9STRA|nr:hypothetical protein PHMEG_0002897 [Phytophthora megakarya]
MDADALSHLKVKDLQRELKKRGLDTSGLKAALLQRLKEHLQRTQSEDMETAKEAEAEKGDEEQADEKDEPTDHSEATDKPTGKRPADKEEDAAPDAKKPKLEEEPNTTSPQPEDEDDKPAQTEDVDNEKAVDDDAEKGYKATLRIDNFVRPFTLNAVKALVQELGNFVEDGFWMDVIKTHCYVTYSSPEVAKKTSSALDGKVWPPENGRALSVKFADHTAMEVSQFGEANLPSRPKSTSDDTQAIQRQSTSTVLRCCTKADLILLFVKR